MARRAGAWYGVDSCIKDSSQFRIRKWMWKKNRKKTKKVPDRRRYRARARLERG